MRGRYGSEQVGREGGDAALARQVVANKSELAESRGFFHDAFPFRPCVPCSRFREMLSIAVGTRKRSNLGHLMACMAAERRPAFRFTLSVYLRGLLRPTVFFYPSAFALGGWAQVTR